MVCYRDMCFCLDAETCPKREGCSRYFSPAEQARAVRWWGNENVPVAFSPMAATCERLHEDDKKGNNQK